MEAIKNSICTWTLPQSVAIQDARLGILDKTLKLVFFIYAPINIFLGGWKYTEVPAGYPTFWFTSGGLYTQQNQSTRPSFCNNPQMDYYEDASSDDAYWNNKGIQCLNPVYNEAVTKTTSYGFVKTMMKRLHINAKACSSSADPCAAVSASLGRPVTRKNVDGVCYCEKQQDYFTVGVEHMSLIVQHAFSTSPAYHEDKDKETVYGSSTYKSSSETKKKVKTCVKKHGTTGGCYKEFEPGQNIDFTIQEWLELAGLTLESKNSKIESPLSATQNPNGNPTQRLTGVKIHVQISYEGNVGDETFKADLKVAAKEGWNSIGSNGRWISYSSESNKEFYDDYIYGISFDFIPSGKVWRFDWQTTFNTIIASLVLIGLSTQINGIVAFYMLKQKEV
eukprot:TRINITY_DN22170_c0_g2_i2.p1 TRINITY_DN22170_c0_g2~~TRINITY_DN22170_c0_g2_i2.p1  ORF type:complete len:407 (+),score=44.87 TRINITY_DN22170_c0_g2_i2:48-1223(+)